MNHEIRPAMHDQPESSPIDALLPSWRAFLGFVQRRVHDPALAEDLLQTAFVRSLERIDQLRDHESVVAWFYRMLRNAVIDHRRRDDTSARKLDELARALERAPEPAPDERDEICSCLLTLAHALPHDQATVLRRVDLEGAAVKDVAAEVGITPNAAGVRLFRARERLRRALAQCCGSCADGGCGDCSCDHPLPPS